MHSFSLCCTKCCSVMGTPMGPLAIPWAHGNLQVAANAWTACIMIVVQGEC